MMKVVLMYQIRKGTPSDKFQIENIASKAYEKYVDLIGKNKADELSLLRCINFVDKFGK